MFSPLAEGLLVDPFESRSVIEKLLDTLGSTFAESTCIDAALGGAVRAGLNALVSLSPLFYRIELNEML